MAELKGEFIAIKDLEATLSKLRYTARLDGLKGEFIALKDLEKAFAEVAYKAIEAKQLKGEFMAIEDLKQILSEVIYKATLPNKVEKFTVDLAIAREKKKLSKVGGGEGLFIYDVKYRTWHYFKVLVKGTGTYTIRFIMEAREPIELDSTEINKGDEISLEFTELEFTNIAQSVTNPIFWLEKRYF